MKYAIGGFAFLLLLVILSVQLFGTDKPKIRQSHQHEVLLDGKRYVATCASDKMTETCTFIKAADKGD